MHYMAKAAAVHDSNKLHRQQITPFKTVSSTLVVPKWCQLHMELGYVIRQQLKDLASDTWRVYASCKTCCSLAVIAQLDWNAI